MPGFSPGSCKLWAAYWRQEATRIKTWMPLNYLRERASKYDEQRGDSRRILLPGGWGDEACVISKSNTTDLSRTHMHPKASSLALLTRSNLGKATRTANVASRRPIVRSCGLDRTLHRAYPLSDRRWTWKAHRAPPHESNHDATNISPFCSKEPEATGGSLSI